jgi:hypothetical protein
MKCIIMGIVEQTGTESRETSETHCCSTEVNLNKQGERGCAYRFTGCHSNRAHYNLSRLMCPSANVKIILPPFVFILVLCDFICSKKFEIPLICVIISFLVTEPEVSTLVYQSPPLGTILNQFHPPPSLATYFQVRLNSPLCTHFPKRRPTKFPYAFVTVDPNFVFKRWFDFSVGLLMTQGVKNGVRRCLDSTIPHLHLSHL